MKDFMINGASKTFISQATGNVPNDSDWRDEANGQTNSIKPFKKPLLMPLAQ